MASDTIRIPHAERFTSWFPDFLRKELAPYPGRGALVARANTVRMHRMSLRAPFHFTGRWIGFFLKSE
jgi:multidrug resistance protein MdtO